LFVEEILSDLAFVTNFLTMLPENVAGKHGKNRQIKSRQHLSHTNSSKLGYR